VSVSLKTSTSLYTGVTGVTGVGGSRTAGTVSGGILNIDAAFGGDSTNEQPFTQFSGAPAQAFRDRADIYYAGTVSLTDRAESGAFWSTTIATAQLTPTKGYVNDLLYPTLSANNQLTGDWINPTAAITHGFFSLGINDAPFVVANGIDKTRMKALINYASERINTVRGVKMILNPLGTDDGGTDDGANIVREAIIECIKENTGNIIRGVDRYGDDRADAKHGTQAGYTAYCNRAADRAAYLSGNQSSITGLGPAVSSAVLKTDEIFLTLEHQRGTDITAPSSGNGGVDATDDGVQMGSTALTRVDANTMKLAFPQGKAPVVGSVVKAWVPYGANGVSLSRLSPDVARDNSSLTLPIQSDVVTATNGDPFQTLSDLVLYWDARGSVKTLTASTELDGLANIAGSVTSIVQVIDGDHATWSATGFKGKGSLVMRAETDINYSAAFTAGGTHCVMMALKMPASMAGANSNMAAFANSAGSTDTQARWTFASDNALYFTNNEASAAEQITPVMTGSQVIYICQQFVDVDTCNVYIMIEGDPTYTDWLTPYKTFDPRNTTDYESQTYITIGGRSAAEDGTLNLEMAAWAHTTSVLSSSDRATCLAYWVSRFA